MTRQKSSKLGRLPGWGGWIVYEALEELACEFCGDTIRVGDQFIRRAVRYNRTGPCCERCSK